jgi:ADP-heptose:LPS heptosyltransferase
VVRTFDLRLLLAAIASCDLLVSGDTGPGHMATALGIPRVTLYGPTDPRQWNPGLPTTPILIDEAVAVMRARDRRKAVNHPGLLGISVEDVLRQVHRLLSAHARGRAPASHSPLPISP